MKDPVVIEGFQGEVLSVPNFSLDSYPYMLTMMDLRWHVVDVSISQVIAKVAI